MTMEQLKRYRRKWRTLDKELKRLIMQWIIAYCIMMDAAKHRI